jgi:hypothetical protein
MEQEMAFAIYKGEKNVNELAARLFPARSLGSKAALKRAGDALLKANPQLKDVSQVPIGSVIAVPADAPPLQPGQSLAPASLLGAFSAARAEQLLDSLDQRLSYLETQASGATNAILALAKTKATQAAAANNPTLKANLPALIKSSETRLKGLKDSQASRAKAIAEVRAELAQFMASS